MVCFSILTLCAAFCFNVIQNSKITRELMRRVTVLEVEAAKKNEH